MNAYLGAGIALIAGSLFGFLYVTFSILSFTVEIFRMTLVLLLPEIAVSLFCGILGGYLLGISRETPESSQAQSAVS